MGDDWRLDDWQLDPPGPDVLKPGEKRVECWYCSCDFTTKRADAKYCSKRCRQAAWRGNSQITTLTLNLDGGIAEVLQAIADDRGMSRQQFVTELVNEYVDLVIAEEIVAIQAESEQPVIELNLIGRCTSTGRMVSAQGFPVRLSEYTIGEEVSVVPWREHEPVVLNTKNGQYVIITVDGEVAYDSRDAHR